MRLHIFSVLRKRKIEKKSPSVSMDGACSSSKQPCISAQLQKKEEVSRMTSFASHFYCCNCMDAAAFEEDDAIATVRAAIASSSKHGDEMRFMLNPSGTLSKKEARAAFGEDDAIATVRAAIASSSKHGDEIRFMLNPSGTLSEKEARAMYRMQFLTASQWAIVTESCGLGMTSDASIADVLNMVMEWRKERGDFGRDADEEEEEQDRDLDGDLGVPRLSDEMQEANEAILEVGFLKTDLQVECLLRGIATGRRN